MLSQIWIWINKRWPVSTVIRWSLEEEIPGGSSFAYTFGSALLAVFILQVTTGIIQLFYYVPSIGSAYDSVNFLRTQVPFGWLVNQIHRQGANLMVVLAVLHLTRVYIFGAYKKPRELTWILGVGLLVAIMALTFTGGPLSWDQKGYWEAEVGSNIPGSIPYVGTELSNLMRGGPSVGQLTLSRLFGVHVGILPALLALLIILHLISFRRFGTAGPWNDEKRKVTGPFWPDQIFKDTVTAIIVVLIIIALGVFTPKPFYGPADPLDASFVPKPEWNFLFLYQTLKYFHGVLEPVGVIGVPAFFVTLLLLVPFIDRSQERNPLKRPVAMLCGLLFAASITTLTLIGYFSRPAATPAVALPQKTERTVPEKVKKGEELFHSIGCISCHRINSEGGAVGPNLSNEGKKGRTSEWLKTQIRNPKAHDLNSIMPPFTSLSEEQVSYLVDFLKSLGDSGSLSGTEKHVATGADPPQQSSTVQSGASSASEINQKSSPTESEQKKQPAQAAYIIGNARHGKDIFEQKCISCHGPNGTDHIPNPGSDDMFVPALNPVDRELFDNDPQAFAKKIDVFVQHGSIPSGPAPQLHMLAFGDEHALTQAQIANVEAYIMRLNGVDRAKIENPGMLPKRFFIIAAPAIIIILLILGGIYKCLP
jgi:ubiquinol-cytochrome c reductase cytochrome b subunit